MRRAPNSLININFSTVTLYVFAVLQNSFIIYFLNYYKMCIRYTYNVISSRRTTNSMRKVLATRSTAQFVVGENLDDDEPAHTEIFAPLDIHGSG